MDSGCRPTGSPNCPGCWRCRCTGCGPIRIRCLPNRTVARREHSPHGLRAFRCAAAAAPRSSPPSARPARRPERIARAVRRRRRRVPAQFQPRHATTTIARASPIIRELERGAGRPIGILVDLQGPKLRLGTLRRAAGSSCRPASASASTSTPTPGDATRAPLPHPEIFAGAASPAPTCCSTTARCGCASSDCGADFAETDGRGRRRALRPQGRQRARRRAADLGADREGPRATSPSRSSSASTGSRCPSCSGPEDVAEATPAGRRPRRRPGQAREAAGDRASRRDHRAVRRGHGGARRSRRRDAAGGRAAACRSASSAPAASPASRSSWRRRCWRSMISCADADAGRGLGRRDRGLSTAPTRSCCRPRPRPGNYPDRGGHDHGPHRRAGGAGPALPPLIDAHAPEPEPNSAGRHQRRGARRSRTPSAPAIVTYTSSGSTTLRAARERPDCPILGLTANIETARRLALVWGVHPLLPQEPNSMSDMVAKALRAAQRRGSPARARRSWSPPACPSARRAPPMRCGWPR